MKNSRVRVLHVASALDIGGTEKVLQLLVSHLDPERFETMAFAFEDGVRGKQLRKAGIPTYISQDLLDVIEKTSPDILHVHRGGWPDPELMRPIKLGRVPVVVETNVFGRFDPSPLAQIIDRHLFVSRFCLERYHHANNIPENRDKYDFLHNPLDTDFLEDTSRKDRDFSQPFAVRISRPDPGKWSALAWEFLPELVKRVPNFKYHVVGAIEPFTNFVRQHDLESSVVLHDPVHTEEELVRFLDQGSVLAHANDTGESFGMVIAEAMACGMPVVTHPAEGNRDNAQLELVDDGVTGIVARNAEEYGRALAWLFENPDKAREMGLAGQRKARELYRVQNVTARLGEMYLELLSKRGLA